MSRTPLLSLVLLLLATVAVADTADVSVDLKTVDRVVTGELFPVTVSLHNAGPDAAVGSRVRITRPNNHFVPIDKYPSCLVDQDGLLCYVNDFAAGETREFALTFTANDKATPMSITATALTTNDPNVVNDTASANVNVYAAPDLQLTVDVYPSLQPGQQSQVRFDTRNLSSTPAGPFTGLFTLPPSLTVVQTPDHCDALDATTYRCDFAGLSIGIVAAAFQVVPANDVRFVTLSGSVDYAGDANPSDNRVTVDVPVYDLAQLTLSIIAPDRLPESRTGAIRYRIENASDVAAHDVSVDLAAGFGSSIVSVAADGWLCTLFGDPDLGEQCKIATLAPHEVREIGLGVTFARREQHANLFMRASQAVPAGFRAAPNNVSLQAVFYRLFDVTTTADGGAGSLRAAIDSVNAQCGGDTDSIPCKIAFQLARPVPSDGWFTIAPGSALPRVTAPDFAIDGEAQSAFTGDTNTRGPEVFLDGSQAGDADGLYLTSSVATVRGLAIGNFARNGLLIDRRIANGPFLQPIHRIERNYLGVDPTGARAAGNGLRGLMAIRFVGFITGNVIGANGRSGIFLEPAQNTIIRDNRIGVAASTDDALPNGASGIYLGPNSNGTTIENNVIANSGEFGISLGRPNTVDIRANTYRNSGHSAIDVGLDGPTLDDPARPVPTILSARYDGASRQTIIEGIGVRRVYPFHETVYVYANDADVAEGQRFVGSALVDGSGHFTLRVDGDLRGSFVAASGSILTDFGDLTYRISTEMGPRLRVE